MTIMKKSDFILVIKYNLIYMKNAYIVRKMWNNRAYSY